MGKQIASDRENAHATGIIACSELRCPVEVTAELLDQEKEACIRDTASQNLLQASARAFTADAIPSFSSPKPAGGR